MSQKLLALVFDIPTKKNALRVRTWRELQRIGAGLKFRSLWVLENTSRNLSDFKSLRADIRRCGGKAEVLLIEVV